MLATSSPKHGSSEPNYDPAGRSGPLRLLHQCHLLSDKSSVTSNTACPGERGVYPLARIRIRQTLIEGRGESPDRAVIAVAAVGVHRLYEAAWLTSRLVPKCFITSCANRGRPRSKASDRSSAVFAFICRCHLLSDKSSGERNT